MRKKTIKTVVFESEFILDAPLAIFSDVEREIIRADMAFLIQKEKDSGDWAKWEASQRELKYPTRPTQRTVGPITLERFIAAVGREPHTDEFDRVNCQAHGTVGHWQCGWCVECEKPYFMCNHLNRG